MNLIFKNFRLIEEDTISKLTELEKEQMLIAGKACWDTPVESIIHNLDDVLGQTYEGNCELWQVFSKKDPEKPLYDVWVFNVDTAVVFYANTNKDTGVGMIQNYFTIIEEETEEAKQLADDLQTAFINRPEIDYLETGGPAKAYHDAVRKIQKSEEDEKTKKNKK